MPVAKIPGRVTATDVAEFNPGTDRLHLEQLELDVRIGVTDEERANPQRIVINLTIWPNFAFEQLQRNLGDLTRRGQEFARAGVPSPEEPEP